MSQEYEIAKLYCDRGDYHLALKYLQSAMAQFLKSKDYPHYFQCAHLALRTNSELKNDVEVQNIKETLQDLVIREGIELTAKICHTLAVCALYKSQFENAKEYWEKSLLLAQKTGSMEDLMNAEFGLTYLSILPPPSPESRIYHLGLEKLAHLEELLKNHENLDLKISTLMLRARLYRLLKNFEDSLRLLWQAFEEIKKLKQLTLYCQILDELGVTYLEMGNRELAEIYLGLAIRSVDKKNQVRLASVIQKNFDRLSSLAPLESADLIVRENSHQVIERHHGQIDFKNQFLLFDFLKLLVHAKGEPTTKEAIARSLWNESYDSRIHDNKIYVTVKRLRNLLEVGEHATPFILRSKEGYFLNKDLRIQIEPNSQYSNQ